MRLILRKIFNCKYPELFYYQSINKLFYFKIACSVACQDTYTLFYKVETVNKCTK